MSMSDEWRPQRGRKDRRRWCGGKVGREHRQIVVFTGDRWGSAVKCGEWPWGIRLWRCYHQVVCVTCGKVFRHTMAEDCPIRVGALTD